MSARARALAAAPALAVAAVATLPFLPGLAAGHSFFFRDLSLHFLPLRRFLLEGLARGELRFWNPLLNEGTPVPLMPVGYPMDLLQLLWPTESGISLVLALHLPLGAVGFFLLGRGLGLAPASAAGGALVYGLGGFALSCVNLYVYAEAVGWAPFVVLALARAAEGGGRRMAAAAIATAIAVTTTGVEIVLQAVLLGLLLGRPVPVRRALRIIAASALGAGLAGFTVLTTLAMTGGSTRAHGFATEVVLAHSVHPLSVAQILIAGFHGDPANPVERWWGANFFPRGFPYLLSLYLGPAALGLAAAGTIRGDRRWRILGLAGAAALVVCLGRWAALDALVEALPVRPFRYPVKAFFTVHAAAALLAGRGLDALRELRGARLVSLSAAGGAAVLILAGALPFALPGTTRWLLGGLLPPDLDEAARATIGRFILADARTGALLAAGVAAIALLRARERLRPALAATAAAGFVAADLIRAGAGLNPMVSPAFYRLSNPMTSATALMRRDGGRVFTFDPGASHAYAAGRQSRGQSHAVWTFALLAETLTPNFNVTAGVPSAYGVDLTMMVPVERVLPPEESRVEAFPAIVDRLEAAGVAHVISLDPVEHPRLRPRAVLHPARLAPVSVRLYALEGARPRFAVRARDAVEEALARGARPVISAAEAGTILASDERPGSIHATVTVHRPARLVVGEACGRGWQAELDGSPVTLDARACGRVFALPLEPGTRQVNLRYSPPGARAGLWLASLSAVVTAVLALRDHRAPRAGEGGNATCAGRGAPAEV